MVCPPQSDSLDASVARRIGVRDRVLHHARLAIFSLARGKEIGVPFGVHHLQLRRTTLRNHQVVRHSQRAPSRFMRLGRHARSGLHPFDTARSVPIGCESVRRDEQSCRGNHGQESHLEHGLCTHNALLMVVKWTALRIIPRAHKEDTRQLIIRLIDNLMHYDRDYLSIVITLDTLVTDAFKELVVSVASFFGMATP